jgi:hypothetical protein
VFWLVVGEACVKLTPFDEWFDGTGQTTHQSPQDAAPSGWLRAAPSTA